MMAGKEMQRECMMKRPAAITASVLLLAACSEAQNGDSTETSKEAKTQEPAASAGTDGDARAAKWSAETGTENARTNIRVPKGFKATVFADGLGKPRHLAVRADGTVYAGLRQSVDGGGTVALKDANGDGSAEKVTYFGEIAGTGTAIRNGYLYRSSDTEILRYGLERGEMVPSGEPETIVTGFPEQGQHATKPMTFDGEGNMYVAIGAPSNACQERMRTPGSPGMEPCPQLEEQAGIWRFDAETSGQVHGEDGARFATGIRNGLALDWHPSAGALYFGTHGRDSLGSLFPEYYNEEDNAELPAEEFHKAVKGGDYGWPFTYWDPRKDARIVAPEYGGDGEKRAEEGKYEDPLIAFPAHWAPNDLTAYRGDAFPEHFQNGFFLAWHGSWNRAPKPQQGYNVTFIPMRETGEVDGDWQVFADKFKGKAPLQSPGNAEHRPTGLAVGPQGALYVADDAGGRIWKITYEGR